MSRDTKPTFKRATRCRAAYKWVRRGGYATFLIGGILFMAGRVGSTGPTLSPMQQAGFLLFILGFVVFLASYGLYFSIRMIEVQPAEPRSSE